MFNRVPSHPIKDIEKRVPPKTGFQTYYGRVYNKILDY
jgi:hypothetical protein